MKNKRENLLCALQDKGDKEDGEELNNLYFQISDSKPQDNNLIKEEGDTEMMTLGKEKHGLLSSRLLLIPQHQQRKNEEDLPKLNEENRKSDLTSASYKVLSNNNNKNHNEHQNIFIEPRVADKSFSPSQQYHPKYSSHHLIEEYKKDHQRQSIQTHWKLQDYASSQRTILTLQTNSNPNHHVQKGREYFQHLGESIEFNNNNSLEEQGSLQINHQEIMLFKENLDLMQQPRSSKNQDQTRLIMSPFENLSEQMQKQKSLRSESNTNERDNSSCQYESPIPIGFPSSHNLENIKRMISLNRINTNQYLQPHLQTFADILERNPSVFERNHTVEPHQQNHQQQQQSSSSSEEQKSNQMSRQQLDLNSFMLNKQSLNQQSIPNRQISAYSHQHKLSSYYSVSQQSSIQNIQRLEQISKQEDLVDIDKLVLDNQFSFFPNQNPRFNKQFFEDLKTQQIGFATILKDRKQLGLMLAKTPSNNPAGADGEDYFTDARIHQKSMIDQRQLLQMQQQNNTLVDSWNVKKKNQNFLTELLTRIEYNNHMKNNIERAIILFNENSKKAIDFLVKNELIEQKPEMIAEFLLTTPGLSKFSIGQYIGLKEDFSIQVLKAFCNKIDFVGMDIDEALRLFLSLFRLPGESQQIDRIIEQFSTIFYEDNPQDFQNVDGVYVLAYSLIFLNTLNHNPNVPASRKLSKKQFISQNLYSSPNFPVPKLEQIYNNVMANEFKTDTQFVEKIYERIRAFNHEETTKETIKRSTTVLQTGEIFLKYGRVGKPHLRYVYVSDNEENLFWCEINEQGKKSKIKWIKCEDIIDIKVGFNATQVLEKHQIPIEFDDLIFSVITQTRTLDLQAKTAEIRNRWAKFLKIVVNDMQLQNKKFRELNNNSVDEYERKQRIKEDLEEIWENDIFANFAMHWDYENHRPKATQKRSFPKAKNQSSDSQPKTKWHCKISNCWNGKKNRKLKCNQRKQENCNNNQYPFDYESDDNNKINHSRGFLLDQLWRRGIPPKYRAKIWPFAIQNKLEISKKLYRMNLKEGHHIVNSLNKQLRTQKKGLTKQILEKIDQDIKETLKMFREQKMRESLLAAHRAIDQNHSEKERKKGIDIENMEDEEEKEFNREEEIRKLQMKQNRKGNAADAVFEIAGSQEKTCQHLDNDTIEQNASEGIGNLQYQKLFNIIIAFIMQRPDIAYLPNMSYLAGLFLIYCNEYDAFASFTNFIHQHYFLDLFKGQLSDIKLRINQFNRHFKEMMPELFKHFETLDITTDLFLIDWMLTLYSKNMDLEIVSRLWDNFMLDGEIFAIKTGLALLKYFESQFIKLSYFKIIKHLRNMQGGKIKESRLFKIIEAIDINEKEYYGDIQMQKWSYQKSKVLGTVFM